MMRKTGNNRFLFVLASLLVASVVLDGCNTETELPPNPYDAIDYPTAPAPSDTLAPNSIVSIHRDILHPRCAVPGCHDGAFEPDFRTVQSSFSTLVYAPIVKNNQDSSFTYRVIPFDTARSVLHERLTNCCFANVDDRMPQDNIGVPLESEFITRIEGWIMTGAQTMFGEVPDLPNLAPTVGYFLAIDEFAENFTEFSAVGNRIDNVIFNPFIMQQNTDMLMVIVIEDDSTAIPDLQINTLRTSYDPNDFSPTASGYQEYAATLFSVPGEGSLWYVPMNTGSFAPDNVVYMRYYVSDGENTTEMPAQEMIIQYKTFWSFYILP